MNWIEWLRAGKRPWRWLLVTAMCALLIMSLLPASAELPSTGWDKANHVLGFAVLGWLGQRSWPYRVSCVVGGLWAYGALIEVLQMLTPDRVAEFADLAADGLGLAVGVTIAKFVGKKLKY